MCEPFEVWILGGGKCAIAAKPLLPEFRFLVLWESVVMVDPNKGISSAPLLGPSEPAAPHSQLLSF
jgi:hypothetical protein